MYSNKLRTTLRSLSSSILTDVCTIQKRIKTQDASGSYSDTFVNREGNTYPVACNLQVTRAGTAVHFTGNKMNAETSITVILLSGTKVEATDTIIVSNGIEEKRLQVVSIIRGRSLQPTISCLCKEPD